MIEEKVTAIAVKISTVRRLAELVRPREKKGRYQKYSESLEEVIIRLLDFYEKNAHEGVSNELSKKPDPD